MHHTDHDILEAIAEFYRERGRPAIVWRSARAVDAGPGIGPIGCTEGVLWATSDAARDDIEGQLGDHLHELGHSVRTEVRL